MRDTSAYDLQRSETTAKDPLLRSLGRRIATLRKERKWQRAHLARRLGVPRTRLAFWERGQHQPPLSMLLALGRVLEVSIEELVEEELTNNPSGAMSARSS
ncbi:MAG TPA: helix-turn-helix transcriptional regulator [Thermoanaerobaculia bacterium]|nr:helix-turn-helix transcriptional regulator [Thermoanaerobaculia bacterium]